MPNTFTPEPAAAWLAERLYDARAALAAKWLDRLQEMLVQRTGQAVPSSDLAEHVPDQIAHIAKHVRVGSSEGIAGYGRVMDNAADLGLRRFTQRATVHQLLREYQILADLLEEFLLEQVSHANPPLAADAVGRAMRRLTQSVRALQQQTIDTFVARYTSAIERQNIQLLSFGRLVGHEMRQPLGVLQLVPAVIPIREGDTELTHLLDVAERNVRRLADVAARLERLSHTAIDETLLLTKQRVDLGLLVGEVVEMLRDAANTRDVHVQIDSELPALELDPACAELVLLNVIGNAIQYSDPAKHARLVEVLSVKGEQNPSVIVRDNGIGIPAERVQHIFREFVRAHAHRDRKLGVQGAGLGLSIVRECMDASGGAVRLESVEGEGTTVTLTWPRRPTPR